MKKEKNLEIADWMATEAATNAEKHICIRTVRKSRIHFSGQANANITRANRYWRDRETIRSTYKTSKSGNDFYLRIETIDVRRFASRRKILGVVVNASRGLLICVMIYLFSSTACENW